MVGYVSKYSDWMGDRDKENPPEAHRPTSLEYTAANINKTKSQTIWKVRANT